MPVWSRRTVEQPEPGPRRVTALEYYGARLLPDLSGWWVYALGAAGDGRIWYAGQSESLLRRLDDHRRDYPDLFDLAQVYLIPCRDQSQANVRELELIDHYQPEKNSVGRTEELRRRVHSQAHSPFQKGHKLSPTPADYAARKAASLDSKQDTP